MREPLILCHAACTGGSVIYRMLVESFGLSGVSEIGHGWLPRKSQFIAWDPIAALYSRGQIDADQFGNILLERLETCEQVVAKSNRGFLIREHTHSYFFDSHVNVELDGPSWIADQFFTRRGRSSCVLVSVRDPIDSWLGLRQSFPNAKPTVFSEYCRVYNDYLDRVDTAVARGSYRIHLFRYEDFVASPQTALNQIADFAGLSIAAYDETAAAEAECSGSSGRQFSRLIKPSRRPYTTSLIREAVASEDYHRLVERLGYVGIEDCLKTTDHLRATKNQVVAAIARRAWSALEPLKNVKSAVRTAKRVQ